MPSKELTQEQIKSRERNAELKIRAMQEYNIRTKQQQNDALENLFRFLIKMVKIGDKDGIVNWEDFIDSKEVAQLHSGHLVNASIKNVLECVARDINFEKRVNDSIAFETAYAKIIAAALSNGGCENPEKTYAAMLKEVPASHKSAMKKIISEYCQQTI